MLKYEVSLQFAYRLPVYFRRSFTTFRMTKRMSKYNWLLQIIINNKRHQKPFFLTIPGLRARLFSASFTPSAP
jgi:hypothetical protein